MGKFLKQNFVLFSLALVFVFAVFARGGYHKVYWFPISFVIVLAGAFFLIGIFRDWRRPGFNLRVDLPLLAFLGWIYLSVPGSIYKSQSAFEASRMACLVVFYFLVAYGLSSSGKKIMTGVIVAVAFFEAVYGLYEFTSGKHLLDLDWVELYPSFYRVRGTFHSKNHFGALVAMAFFLQMGMVLAMRGRGLGRNEKAASVLLYSLPSSILVLALVLSLSRGAWISFLVALPVFLLMLYIKSGNTLTKLVAVVVFVTLLAGAMVAVVDREPLMARLDTLEEMYSEPGSVPSFDSRSSLWKSGIRMMADDPFTGKGWGTFKWAYPAYRTENIMKGPVFAHNTYVHIAATAGLPALLSFLVFIVSLFREGIGVMRKSGNRFMGRSMPGIMAAMAYVLCHEMVDFNLMLPANAMVFFALAGFVASAAGERAEAKR